MKKTVRLLSFSDVLEVTEATVRAMTCEVVHSGGLTRKEFRTWCERGVVSPVAGGGRPGRHRRFTDAQAVAIAYAAQWWRSGSGLESVRSVIGCLAALGERGLRRKAETGRWMVCPIPGSAGVLFPVGNGEDVPCVLELGYVYDRVMKKIGEIEERLKTNYGGRTRGLAGAAKREVN